MRRRSSRPHTALSVIACLPRHRLPGRAWDSPAFPPEHSRELLAGCRYPGHCRTPTRNTWPAVHRGRRGLGRDSPASAGRADRAGAQHRARSSRHSLAGGRAGVTALAWTRLDRGTVASGLIAVAAAVALVHVGPRPGGRPGGLGTTAAAIGPAVIALFVALVPDRPRAGNLVGAMMLRHLGDAAGVDRSGRSRRSAGRAAGAHRGPRWQCVHSRNRDAVLEALG